MVGVKKEKKKHADNFFSQGRTKNFDMEKFESSIIFSPRGDYYVQRMKEKTMCRDYFLVGIFAVDSPICRQLYLSDFLEVHPYPSHMSEDMSFYKENGLVLRGIGYKEPSKVVFSDGKNGLCYMTKQLLSARGHYFESNFGTEFIETTKFVRVFTTEEGCGDSDLLAGGMSCARCEDLPLALHQLAVVEVEDCEVVGEPSIFLFPGMT